MSNLPREVRVRQLPDRFEGKVWHTKPQPIVRLGDVGKWSVVRNADFPQACPFVMSRKEWDKLPAQGTEARRAETPKSGSVHDGPVAKRCAPMIPPNSHQG